jgi:hypothetical protein
MPNDIERCLDIAMIDMYHCARNEADYNGTRYIQMHMNIEGLNPRGYYCTVRQFPKDMQHNV